jgi:glycosyltransferase involved in cell wall biosynthesis
MRIAIATVQVPFVRGGAENLAEGLRDALVAAGHEAELVAVPFKWHPPERLLDALLACRLLDLSESAGVGIDRVIGLKFPAYAIPHPDKVLWLVHQHRSAYDLWDHPFGDLIRHPNGPQVRDAVIRADQEFIPQAAAVYSIARNVSKRLRQYNGIDSTPLYHPPKQAEAFHCEAAEPYLFFPSRLCPSKRQVLVLQALPHTRHEVRVVFAGAASGPAYAAELRAAARRLKVERRVDWLGPVSEDDKRRHYARCLGVVFPPVDEDYGYVTLEAMLSGKPVATCVDSGGPLEFVRHGQTGLVSEPTAEALAAAMDQLWEGPARAAAWGRAGRAAHDQLGVSWANVVEKLAA